MTVIRKYPTYELLDRRRTEEYLLTRSSTAKMYTSWTVFVNNNLSEEGKRAINNVKINVTALNS